VLVVLGGGVASVPPVVPVVVLVVGVVTVVSTAPSPLLALPPEAAGWLGSCVDSVVTWVTGGGVAGLSATVCVLWRACCGGATDATGRADASGALALTAALAA
jgi:hypothetical protein